MTWHRALVRRFGDWRWLGIVCGVALLHVLLLSRVFNSTGPADSTNGVGKGRLLTWTIVETIAPSQSQPSPKLKPPDDSHRQPDRDRGRQAELVGAEYPTADFDLSQAPSPAHYFVVDEVDTLPIVPDQLDYGEIEIREWRLTLRLWISSEGRVDHAEVFEATPSGPWVTKVLGALTSSTLSPAKLAGEAVPVQIDIQLGPEVVW